MNINNKIITKYKILLRTCKHAVTRLKWNILTEIFYILLLLLFTQSFYNTNQMSTSRHEKSGRFNFCENFKKYDIDIKTIGKHINNALNEELKDDNSVVAKILKNYMLKGYAVNQRTLEYSEKTVKFQESTL